MSNWLDYSALPVSNRLPAQQRLEALESKTLTGTSFAELFDRAKTGEKPDPAANMTMTEAAHQMEIMLTTFMLKTMEETSTEGGLLGKDAHQGMGYFKDLFLQEVAENMIGERGLGFEEAITNLYNTK